LNLLTHAGRDGVRRWLLRFCVSGSVNKSPIYQ